MTCKQNMSNMHNMFNMNTIHSVQNGPIIFTICIKYPICNNISNMHICTICTYAHMHNLQYEIVYMALLALFQDLGAKRGRSLSSSVADVLGPATAGEGRPAAARAGATLGRGRTTAGEGAEDSEGAAPRTDLARLLGGRSRWARPSSSSCLSRYSYVDSNH